MIGDFDLYGSEWRKANAERARKDRSNKQNQAAEDWDKSNSANLKEFVNPMANIENPMMNATQRKESPLHVAFGEAMGAAKTVLDRALALRDRLEVVLIPAPAKEDHAAVRGVGTVGESEIIRMMAALRELSAETNRCLDDIRARLEI